MAAFKTTDPVLSGGFANWLPSILTFPLIDAISMFVAVTTPDPARKSPPEIDWNSSVTVMFPLTWTVPWENNFTTLPPEIGLANVKLELAPRA